MRMIRIGLLTAISAAGLASPASAADIHVMAAGSLKEVFTPLDALRNFEDEWQLLTITAKGHVATFNEEFRRLRLQLDPHSPMTPQQLLEAYASKLRPNEGAYKSFIQ